MFPFHGDWACVYLPFFPFSFSPDTPGLREPYTVESFQDQAQVMLNDYERYANISRPMRFGRLLLSLPALRGVSSKFLENLFFKQTIGNIPIERLLSDMFQNSWWVEPALWLAISWINPNLQIMTIAGCEKICSDVDLSRNHPSTRTQCVLSSALCIPDCVLVSLFVTNLQ